MDRDYLQSIIAVTNKRLSLLSTDEIDDNTGKEGVLKKNQL